MHLRLAALLLAATTLHAQSALDLTFGAKALTRLSYIGTTLEDTAAFPADTFHIWHMRVTDLAGTPLPQYSWGETNLGEAWNPATSTETYTFPWGTIATRFVPAGNTLNLVVTETNHAGSGVLLDGAEIFPFALHLPHDPAGFSGYSQFAVTTTGPAITPADFGSGIVTAVVPDASLALYAGWKSLGSQTYAPILTTTAPDGLPTFLPSLNTPVAPGATLTYTVSLRFTPEGTPAIVADANQSFAATYPNQLHWTDRRAIGTAYLASSPPGSGNITQPGGFPTNPRRYFNDPAIDITSPAGLRAFQDRMLAQAASIATNAENLAAQGVITWDLEGEQYPQDTSYVCSPDLVATVAPEMESTITDPASPFAGQKLDDAYFHTIAAAGLRVGLCLRPQTFTPGPSNTASQRFSTTNAAILATLERKARFAISRWNATLFYVDSTVDPNGGTLDPAIFEQLHHDLPNVLFIPEESTPRYYASTAPFYSFLFHTTLGTPVSIRALYPTAFGANLINDVAPSTLATWQPQLTAAVRAGDILMGHADFWQANNPTIREIYTAAGVAAPKSTRQTPALSWSNPAAIPFGTPLTAAELRATSSVPGTFAYTPAPGTVLHPGANALTVHFTPADPSRYTPATATTTLQVTRARPLLRWPTPAALPAGTALSATQLDATASLPGTFRYSPAPGTIPPAGTNLLTTTFTPANTTDYAPAIATVSLTVTGNDPHPTSTGLTILSPTASTTVSGTLAVSADCTLALDAAGSFLLVDGAEIGTTRVTGKPFLYPLDTTTLRNGPHTLQLWAHTIANTTTRSTPITVTVRN